MVTFDRIRIIVRKNVPSFLKRVAMIILRIFTILCNSFERYEKHFSLGNQVSKLAKWFVLATQKVIPL